MKTILLNLFLVGFIITSCNNGVIKEHQDLSPELQWKLEDVRTFTFAITESKDYHLNIDFRYVDGFPFDQMKVKMLILKDGDVFHEEILSLKVRDENGGYLGDVALDIWDSEHEIWSHRALEPGNYEVQLSNAMPNDYLPTPYCMEIGLRID